MLSSSRCHKKPCSPVSAPVEVRDWTSLTHDILVDVFQRLGPCCEIMQAAECMCKTWRRAAISEPLLWRHIDISTVSQRSQGQPTMARAAVDRSQGQCEAFCGPVDMDSLLYLVERYVFLLVFILQLCCSYYIVNANPNLIAYVVQYMSIHHFIYGLSCIAPRLKSFHLSANCKVDNDIFTMALKKLTILKDLEISASYSLEDLLKYACQACPHLEKLKVTLLDDTVYYGSDGSSYMEFSDGGLCEISTMCKLRSLELLDFELTMEGLTTILDNCPILEPLHITGSILDIQEMDEDLQVKCARVRNLILPVDDDKYDCYLYSAQP
ncbi:hypothetical protein PR202_ga27486 [Eleusine coracana subsp. coracana]|uniref:F-box domain-containing protein n=1 Tax=Eleusine coracana subsp. coracana TaxID=191504 RepID=A0AAV5DHA4_ELECO|nr:hypothetical protein PR202_ga27486 [Eleusine coracana subsp. coracana]